jgi:signal transduction histidine kinase
VKWIPFSLRAQLGMVLVAAVVTVAVAVLLIVQLVGNTEGLLVAEARRQTALAAEQLQRQLLERLRLDFDSPLGLPAAGRHLSLRAISETVLGGFPAVEGGYWLVEEGEISGAVVEADDVTEPLRDLASKAQVAGRLESTQMARGADVWVFSAVPVQADGSPAAVLAWTLKQLRDVRSPGRFRLNIYLALLTLTSLLAVGSTLAVAIRLRRQVRMTTEGIRTLENDLDFRFPPSGGEFGKITDAVNRMSQQRKQLELELRRQAQLAVLGGLVAGVAHEVRNPLNNLQLTLQLLLRNETTPGITEKYRRLLEEVGRMEEIVQQLLSLVRRDSGERSSQLLAPVLRDSIAAVFLQSKQKDVQVAFALGNGERPVMMNPAQLQQVFVNLIRNAVEAAPERSSVSVSLSHDENSARVSIADGGPGVSPQDRGQLFQPFFTTKPQGVGLGLAISREIVEAHNGAIAFECGPAGTTVTVSLPVEREPQHKRSDAC